MVFYGTETPVNSEEELDMDKPGPRVEVDRTPGNGAPDGRNVIDIVANDPLTDRQQVNRVSHLEVQDPTMENQTSGGCKSHDQVGCLGGCLILLLLISSSYKQFTWTSSSTTASYTCPRLKCRTNNSFCASECTIARDATTTSSSQLDRTSLECS